MKNLTLSLVCFVLFGSATAFAGMKSDFQVYASTVAGFAEGSLGSARNSADGTQYIGCTMYAYSGSPLSAYCYAINAAGLYVTCTTSTPLLVNAARALRSDGFLYFRWDSNGGCTAISATTSSYDNPKQL
jgi:hypothetical protein